MLEVPEGYIRKRSSTIPFGYALDENTKGYLKPIKLEINALNEVIEMVHKEDVRGAIDLLRNSIENLHTYDWKFK